MRLIKTIPHHKYHIQLHEYNNKLILSVELDEYKQLFKIPYNEEIDILKMEKNLYTNFLPNCLNRFIEMRSDWLNLINEKE